MSEWGIWCTRFVPRAECWYARGEMRFLSKERAQEYIDTMYRDREKPSKWLHAPREITAENETEGCLDYERAKCHA
jgi:hypothetical protein